MKIIKQCRDFFPSTSSGHLLGLDVNGVLQITNSYPLPTSQDDLPPGANLETERRRQQAVWTKTLSEVNVDNNMVGWYQSAYLGSFMNARVVDGLLALGQNQLLNDKAILIIHGMIVLFVCGRDGFLADRNEGFCGLKGDSDGGLW
jgi:translation initiation factor 3 subunit H